MTSDTYNSIVRFLAIGSLAALALGIVFLTVAIARWRGPNRRRWLLASAICVAAFPLMGASIYVVKDHVFLPALKAENDRRRQELLDTASLVHAGDVAPELTLTDIEGKTFALADLRGKVVLINFFAVWCGPCWRELPHVQKLWDEHGDDERFALIVIGCKETDDSVKAFRAKNNYSFPMAADSDNSQYDKYARRILPNTYIVAPDGRIAYSADGFEESDAGKLRGALERQLSLIK